MASQELTARVDSWIWSVRLVTTRSQATAACRAGHVHLNGDRVKPAHAVRAGDTVRVRHGGHERIVVVTRVLSKRTSAAVAGECFIDHSPPPVHPGCRGGGCPRPWRRTSDQARPPRAGTPS